MKYNITIEQMEEVEARNLDDNRPNESKIVYGINANLTELKFDDAQKASEVVDAIMSAIDLTLNK